MEKGDRHRVNADDVCLARKKVVAATIDAETRKRLGDELEKSVFLERYKDYPEVLRKGLAFVAASFHPDGLESQPVTEK